MVDQLRTEALAKRCPLARVKKLTISIRCGTKILMQNSAVDRSNEPDCGLAAVQALLSQVNVIAS